MILPTATAAAVVRKYGTTAEPMMGRSASTSGGGVSPTSVETSEPDIIHEVIGHANQVADPAFARIYRLVGQAVHCPKSEEALRFLSQVFWFTMEFAVVEEHGELRAYNAGILSSVGETESFQAATVRPVDLVEMGTLDYDITHYQPLLYRFSSPAELEDTLVGFYFYFYSRFEDRYHRELLAKAS
jgi:phenylalanine-4-hydroxylase